MLILQRGIPSAVLTDASARCHGRCNLILGVSEHLGKLELVEETGVWDQTGTQHKLHPW